MKPIIRPAQGYAVSTPLFVNWDCRTDYSERA